MDIISSRQNPLIRTVASYTEKKARENDGVFTVDGFTVLFEALEKNIAPKYIFIASFALPERKEKITALAAKHERVSVYEITPPVLEKISTEKSSDGFFSVFGKDTLPSVPETLSGHFVALERVQDPGNVGTVIRSAAAFGISAVFTVSSADHLSQKTVRSSMGGVFTVPVKEFSSTAEMFSFLKGNNIKTVAAVLHDTSRDIRELDLSGNVCAVIGNEGAGLSKEAVSLSDEKAVIPITGAESLNASVAASVFMWEMRRKG